MQKCEFPSETEQRNSPSEPIVSAFENTLSSEHRLRHMLERWCSKSEVE